MMGKYILDENKNPVPCDDLLKWSTFMETGSRRVARTEKKGILVSTVFLGIDHDFMGGEPVVFETMVFQGESLSDIDCRRYTTWDDAIKGHASMCLKHHHEEAA